MMALEREEWLCSVRVLNVVKDMVEMLELYLENPQKGGGDFQSFMYDPDENHVTVIFKESRVAEALIALRSVSLNYHNMPIIRVPLQTQDEVAGAPREGEVTKILVSGIDSELTRDNLEDYFENKRRSNGGPTKMITLIPEEGKAIIEFEDSDVALRVLQQPAHTLLGCQLHLSQLDRSSSRATHKEFSCAITVRGIHPSTSQDMLSLFFESTKRSGGDLIEQLIYSPEQCKAVITFENRQVVERIIEKNAATGLCLNTAELIIEPLYPVTTDDATGQEEVDTHQIIVYELPMSICTADIAEYFRKVKTRVSRVTYSHQPGVALVQFSHPYDYDKLITLVRLKPLKDYMIGIRKVTLPDSVQVNSRDTLTSEMLALYFENPKRFGSDVEVVDVRFENGFTVVKFSDKNVQCILHTDNVHVLGKVQFEVVPFIEYFSPALPNSGGESSWVPQDVSVAADPQVIRFILSQPALSSRIEQLMADIGSCTLVWPSISAAVDTQVCIHFPNNIPRSNLIAGLANLCEDKLVELLSSFRHDTVFTSLEMWGEFEKQVKSEVFPGSVQLEFDPVNCSVTAVAEGNCLKQVIKQLSDIRASIESEVLAEIERVKSITTETVLLASYQIALLQKCGILSVQPCENNLQVTVNVQYGKVTMRGLQALILEKKLKMFEFLTSAACVTLPSDDVLVKFLSEKKFKNHLEQYAVAESITKVVWEHSSSGVIFCGANRAQVEAAISKLKSAFESITVSLDEVESALLNMQVWEHFKSSIYLNYPTLEIIETSESLTLTMASEVLRTVVELVQNFIQEHAVRSELVPVSSIGVLKMVERRIADEFSKLFAGAESDSSFTIRAASRDEDHSGLAFVISGSACELKNAAMKLNNIAAQVVERKTTIDRPGIRHLLHGPRGPKILKSWSAGVDVHIHIVSDNDVDGAQNLGRGTSLAFRELEVIQVTTSLVLKIAIGDITKCGTDAIVCPANKDLQHYGGLAFYIVEQGGYEIQDECNAYIRNSSPLPTAGSFVSKPGRLPCKAIIHAVGPIWSNGRNDEVNLLFTTVSNLLKLCETRGFSSVAIPAISAGLFRFPLEKATKTIMQAIMEFNRQPKSRLHEILVIDKSSEVAQQFVFSAQSVFKDIGYQKSPQRKLDAPDQGTSRIPIPAKIASSSLVSGNTLTTLEGIAVTLLKGSLITQQVDVIVNTVGRDLNLSNGAVARLILATAGPEIQTECQILAAKGIEFGQVVLTKGYGLKCSSVFHGACTQWDNNAGQCEKTFRKFLSGVLNKAHETNAKSIALPAIGTGNLRIPPALVAQWMFNEVEEFSRNKPATSLRDVRFVINDTDTVIHTEFQSEMQNSTRFSVNSNPVTSSTLLASPSGSGKPRALKKSNENVLDESAAASRTSGVWNFKLNDLAVIVKQGDITQETIDVVVNSSNAQLNLGRGAVSKAISDAAGPQLKQECLNIVKNNNWQKKGLAITSGGNLKAKHVFHIDGAQTSWMELVKSCLEEAENMGMKSITFPLLGTGHANKSATEMATIMLGAFSSFSKKHKSPTLELLQIVIFQQKMFEDFAAALQLQTEKRSSVVDKAKRRPSLLTNRALHPCVGWSIVVVLAYLVVQGTLRLLSNQALYPYVGRPIVAVLGVLIILLVNRRPLVELFGFGHSSKVDILEHPGMSMQSKQKNSISLRISAFSESDISRVIKEIKTSCDEMIKEKTIEDEMIGHLSDAKVARIQALDVDIPLQIEVNKSKNLILLRGTPEFITEVIPIIYSIFHEVHEEKRCQMETDLISKQVQWMYRTENGYESYPVEINSIIEQAYRRKDPKVEWLEEDDRLYSIDFVAMTELISGNFSIGKKVKRITPDNRLPKHWDPMPPNELVYEVKLDPTSNEYKEIETKAKSSSQGTLKQIISITRIQNQTLYQQYIVHKEQMQNLSQQPLSVERVLWHGTSVDAMVSIERHGFNRSYCGKNATAYGRGVYFALSFAYSAHNTYSVPDSNGNKHIYQSRVLTGDFTTGQASFIVPPPKASPSGDADVYNSVVDNTANPQIFVIFRDAQAYPEYRIVFN